MCYIENKKFFIGVVINEILSNNRFALLSGKRVES